MLDRIEELVKSIREMTDNIAHDLKSPVTRIRGFAELALVHEDNIDNYRTMASTTIEESDRLLDMINTMLLISKTEAGEGNFTFERMDLSYMVQDACELFLPLAEDKKIKMAPDIQPQVFVDADIKMLQRAVSNILDNAIKYTQKGGTIQVSVHKNENEAIIVIKDTGIGIESHYFEKIFERFFRTESSRTTSGTGLGLSLANTIIKAHKGCIKVSSKPLVGSEFELKLPIDNLSVI